jgi:phosphoglycerol transferase MdoB-like AlkP superfamily enzyme
LASFIAHIESAPTVPENWGKVVLRAAFSLAATAFAATLLAFAVEVLARGSFGTAFDFFAGLHRPAWTTAFVLAMVIFAADAALGRRHRSLLLLAPPLLILAWIGSQKALYLGDPLYPTDFLYYRQIVELMPLLARDRPLTVVAMVVAAVGGLALLVYGWRLAARHCRPIGLYPRLARLAIALPLLAFFVSIMDYRTFSWTRDRLDVIPRMWDQKDNYAANGFVLAFALNLPMATVAAPSGYSAEAIDRIAGESGLTAPATGERPDVVIVMSESFWDSTRLPGVTITPDPIPTARSLRSGEVFSPEFGGMTANVEFEALTGFSNAFLPYGSIPYQQYVRTKIPSLATFFREQGYATTAVHPFQGWFWNRSVVYDAFGFERFLSEENLPPLEKRGPLASDAAMTEELIRLADAEEKPFFIFAVSLQGHGPYEPNRYKDASHAVTAPALSERARGAVQSFSEGVSDADRGLARLVEWAKGRERPTVIAFFGDHLPPLGEAYVQSGYMKEPVASRRAPLAQMKAEHETPLVIWSNRTGPRADVGTISPAFLPLEVLEAAGMEHPYYTGFLGAVRDSFPVVDRHLLVDRDGKAFPDWARAGEVDPLVRDFRLLQYDVMFGDRHALDRFFPGLVHAPAVALAR